MPLFSLLLAVLAGISIYAGLHFLLHFFYSKQARARDSQFLFFGLMCLAVVGFIISELAAYHAIDSQAYVSAYKWRTTFSLLIFSSWIWFVYRYSGVGPRILVLTLSVYPLLQLVPNYFRPYGEFFDTLPILVGVTFPWGEHIATHGMNKMNFYGALLWSSLALQLAYSYYSAIVQYRRGFRHQGAMMFVAMTVCSAFVIETLLVRIGALDFIFLAQFGFPALVIIMGVALHQSTRQHIERISAIIDHVPAVVYVKDANSDYLMINKQYETLFNVKNYDFIGGSDSQVFGEDTANSLRESDLVVLKNNEVVEFDEVVRHSDDTLHNYHSIKFPLTDSSNEPYAVCGISVDITEHKKLDHAVNEAEGRYRSLVESTAAIPWEADIDSWYFTYVGKQAEEVLSYPVEKWYEKDFWTEHIHPDDRKSTINFCLSESRKGREYEFEYRMIASDGRIVWLQDYVQVICENGKPIRLQGYMFDITERKLNQEKINQNESKFRMLFETASDAIFLLHEDKFIDCNPKALKLFNCSRDDIIGNTPLDFSPLTQYDGAASSKKVIEKVSNVFNGIPQSYEWQHCQLDGTLIDTEISLNQIELEDKACLQAIVRDVTARRRNEDAMRMIATGVSAQSGEHFYHQMVIQLSKLFDARYAFIGILDDDDVRQVNTLALSANGAIIDNFSYNLDYTPCENVIGQRTCVYPDKVQELFPKDIMLQDMELISYIGSPLFDTSNNAVGLVVVMDVKPMTDVERLTPVLEIFSARAAAELERIKAESHIRRLAFKDYLTGLANRAALHEHMLAELKNIKNNNSFGAMLLIDLDHFKTINDALSHDVGDQVLKLISQRLQDLSDQNIYLSRVGGDEFVAVMTTEEKSTAQQFETLVRIFAGSIVNELSKPLHLDNRILNVGASVGVVLFPQQGDNEPDIMRRADMALYSAKNRGRGNVQFYEGAMQEVADERLQIERGLRHAIEKNELTLHYQPQVGVGGEFIGAEALLRWKHPELGQVPPDRFIPVAEETGLIHAIGDWVLHEACRQISEWQKNKINFTGHISINVSAWQFANTEFVNTVVNAMDKYNLEPHQVVLELTETAILYDVEETRDKLKEFNAVGVRIALDDFGTGYSSLAYLKDMPMQILKIDRAFINELSTKGDHPLVETIIAMGQHMNLDIIAEGVETELQHAILIDLGCEGFQGYYFSRPLAATDFSAWLAEYTSTLRNKKSA